MNGVHRPYQLRNHGYCSATMGVFYSFSKLTSCSIFCERILRICFTFFFSLKNVFIICIDLQVGKVLSVQSSICFFVNFHRRIHIYSIQQQGIPPESFTFRFFLSISSQLGFSGSSSFAPSRCKFIQTRSSEDFLCLASLTCHFTIRNYGGQGNIGNSLWRIFWIASCLKL